jgi:hypothetical protein
MTGVLISCAGDNDLAKRIHEWFLSAYPDGRNMILLGGDEILIMNKELGIKKKDARKVLSKFLSSNQELADYSVIEFEDVFTVGILQDLDKIIFSCDMCGYICRHEEELIMHKRIIHTMIAPWL